MKKLMKIFVLVAAAAMALASCQKPEIENVQPQEYEYTFLIGNADTKATVGETCVEWEDGDQMGVYTISTSGTSYNRGGNITPGSPAKMVVSSYYALSVGDKVYAYYPYVSSNSEDAANVNLEISAIQDGVDDMPMVSIPFAIPTDLAEKTDKELNAGEIKFANLGSVIEFNLYTETDAYAAEVVESVTFEADKALAGAFTFDLTNVNYSDESTLSIAGLTETTIVANASDLAVGTKVDPAVVKMVVAPGTYAGSIIVKTDVATYTFPISTAKEFKRSAIKPLGLNLRENVREVNNTSKEVTISFATTGQRVSQDENQQKWSNEGVVFINDKTSGSNPVVGNVDPVRLYKNSTITISAPGNISKIEFICNNADYATALNNSIEGSSKSSTVVIVEASSNSVTYTLSGGQVRLNSVNVTYTPTGEDVTLAPELSVTTSEVEVPAAGGNAEFEYTVTNPTAGVSVSASTEENWISGFVYSTANKVTFTVAENTATEAREAVITLSYTGAVSKTVTVKQDAKVPEGMKVDVLTRETTGVEGTSYAEWSDKTVTTSSAVYAGQSAGGNEAIQLRSKENNSGIVTTKSGGYVKKVVVTWNSNTASGRTLNVYGKNSAYSAASDLYDSNTQGTLLGTIINETSTELEVTGNYQYIGLRSADGAMYLDEIKITWSSEASDAPFVPELAVNPATVEVAAAGGNAEFGYTVTNPTAGVSVSASTEENWISDFVYSTANKVSFTVAENTATEPREAVVTLSYTGAESKTVTIKQAAAESSEPETPGDEGTYYVKVTSAPTDWSGTYLIVYESGKVAFNGELTTLDATSNTVNVTISGDKIEANDATTAASFTINASGHIQSASGFYIGQASDANGLKSSKTTTYVNTLSLNSDGTVNIVSGGAYLRYNANSGQYRFRYFKSGTYTGQKAIALYKLQ